MKQTYSQFISQMFALLFDISSFKKSLNFEPCWNGVAFSRRHICEESIPITGTRGVPFITARRNFQSHFPLCIFPARCVRFRISQHIMTDASQDEFRCSCVPLTGRCLQSEDCTLSLGRRLFTLRQMGSVCRDVIV
jgi:hypothetical protein